MELTMAHWVYALVTVIVIVTMLFRKGVVLPVIIGTFLTAVVYKGSVVGGFMAVFNANLTAAKELFNIFLIIALMIGLLNSLKNIGADKKMIIPIQKMMVNGHVSFLVLGAVTYVISLFFWPTPAVPLICALLVPAAVRSGLPVMTAAMIIVITGQGMALSSDYIIQVAPMLSASAASIETAGIANKALMLSVITGASALLITYLMVRTKINVGEEEELLLQGGELFFGIQDELAATAEEEAMYERRRSTWGKAFAVLVPLSMLAVMIYMFLAKFSGGAVLQGRDGAAFIGGVAMTLLILATIAYNRIHALDKISDHITDGFVFAFRAMAPVIPIAGFFFMGNSDFTGSILSLGEEAAHPAFLFDLIQSAQSAIPQNEVMAGLGILLVGLITGLDGSGFSGLPLTGALSGAMAGSAGIDPATMAAIGQMGAIWSGGTLVAWSSLVAVAGFLQLSPLELARRNVVPVLTGLLIATIVALVIW